jgi:hypothetical protein
VGTFDVGSTVAGESSRLNGVDFDGNVVAGWQDGGFRQGAVWVDGIQELIFKGPSDPAQEVSDVSGDGQWVCGRGGSMVFSGFAYRYNTVTDVYESLPNLIAGAGNNMAGSGITDGGKTIVGGTWSYGPASMGNAFIWREGIGTVPFSDYLDEKGVIYPASYNFAFASAISSDGQWIAGWGSNGGPADHSWIVHIPVVQQPLMASIDKVSARHGGTVDFSLNAGSDNAGRDYFVLGSVSGTLPGTPLPGGATLPLNWDLVTEMTIVYANTSMLMNSNGILDGDGKAAAQLNLTGPLPMDMVGLTMNYAFVLYDAMDYASNAVGIKIEL